MLCFESRYLNYFEFETHSKSVWGFCVYLGWPGFHKEAEKPWLRCSSSPLWFSPPGLRWLTARHTGKSRVVQWISRWTWSQTQISTHTILLTPWWDRQVNELLEVSISSSITWYFPHMLIVQLIWNNGLNKQLAHSRCSIKISWVESLQRSLCIPVSNHNGFSLSAYHVLNALHELSHVQRETHNLILCPKLSSLHCLKVV